MADTPTRTPGAAHQAGPHYDYHHQAWTQDGRYLDCAHPATMQCKCYGRLHAGQPIAADAQVPTLSPRWTAQADALTARDRATLRTRAAQAGKHQPALRFRVAALGAVGLLIDTRADDITSPVLIGAVALDVAQQYADQLNRGAALVAAVTAPRQNGRTS